MSAAATADRTLAIVIASKNRAADLDRALRSIAAQTHAPDAVIVIDQSTQPYDLAAFPTVDHVYDPRLGGLPAARNVGIDRVRAARVLFIDDDVALIPTTIAALHAAFDAHPDVAGWQCDDREPHNYGRLNDLIETVFGRGFFAPRKRIARGTFVEMTSLGGYAMAFRGDVIARERFDEKLGGYAYGEDWDYSKRAARYGRLLVAPGADVHHYHSPTNRAGAAKLCRMRWANYRYFFRKHLAAPSFSERVWHAWWAVGESYRWLRAGLGLPSDRKALGTERILDGGHQG